MATNSGKTGLRVLALGLGGSLALGACAPDAPTQSQAWSAEAAKMSGMGSEMSLKEGALYVAELHPLNAWVQQRLDPDPRTPRGVTEGKAYFRVKDGMLTAVVDVQGAEPNDSPLPEGLHPQHIHAASQCPPMSADVNGDRIVDVIEGLPFYGAILVPLDGDISNTTSEIPTFPIATGDKGTYHYTASTSLATLEAAIGAPLALPTRHVVVHGVDINTPLPSTVQSLPGLPAQITLPVACGEIREVR
ncbi:MAG TPA: hypothetical protein VFJ74_02135 [Gemmatimonadaceae bacterium]|nr:hypothetical protein [Gemmatimonadaceae bacterium]